MYSLIDIVNPIKPKYQDNDMFIYFDSYKAVFYPSPDIAILRTNIKFDGTDESLIKFSDINDLDKSITNLNKDLIKYYNFDIPKSFCTITLSNEVLDFINSVVSCGEDSATGFNFVINGKCLDISAQGIDYIAKFSNNEYFFSPMKISITSSYNLAYYLYTIGKLYSDKKNGLTIKICQDSEYVWFSCEDVFIRVENIYPIISLNNIEDFFDNISLSDPSGSDRKLLNDIYGTRFKHLSKCFGDIVTYKKLSIFTVFFSKNVKVALCGTKDG